MPFLKGTKAVYAEAIGPGAVVAKWRLANGAFWTLACNLGAESCTFEPAWPRNLRHAARRHAGSVYDVRIFGAGQWMMRCFPGP